MPVLPNTVIETLQKQVADLTKRVQDLEATQAHTVGFTKSGNDLVLHSATGNIVVRAQAGRVELDGSTLTARADTTLDIRAGASMNVNASSSLDLKGGSVNMNGTEVTVGAVGPLHLKAGTMLDQKGALITLN